MKYKRLGDTGLIVSELSFGTWITFKEGTEGQISDAENAFQVMEAGYKAGVNFFDNAEAYSGGEAETIMGKAVQLGLEKGTWEREDLILSTKLFFGAKVPEFGMRMNRIGLSRKHIIEGMKASLKRMQMDYVDLVFCHRFDPLANLEEVVRAFNYLIDQGMCFYWGTSEWTAQEIQEARGIAARLNMVGPSFDQPQYNMFVRDKVEVEYSRLYPQVGLTTWSPLAYGLLTGKYKGGVIPPGSRMDTDFFGADLKKDGDSPAKQKFKQRCEAAENLEPVAAKIGCTLPQLALAWCIANPNVTTVIGGASSLKQMEENLKAVDFVDKLTPEIMDEIDKVLANKPPVPSQTAMAKNFRTRGNFLRLNV